MPPYADFSTVNATASAADTTRAKMTYTYDSCKRLTKVDADVSNADATYGYNSVGSLGTMRYRNSVETAYTYNTRNQLNQMATTGGASASFQYHSAGWPAARQLAISGLRNRMQETIGANSRTVDYDYDRLNRLTQETINGTASVRYDGKTPVGGSGSDMDGYDLVGNRQSRRSTVVGVASTPSKVSYDLSDRLDNDTNPSSLSTYFDPNGNTLKPDLDGNGVVDSTESAYTYTYNLENHLTGVNDGAGKTITIVYDGDGNRVTKMVDALGTANDSTTTYVLDDRNLTGYAQVLEERDASGNTLVRYVYGLDLISQTRNTGTVGSPVWTTHYLRLRWLGNESTCITSRTCSATRH